MLGLHLGNQAEVEDHDPPFACDQNVGRLDIPMKLAFSMKRRHTVDELGKRVGQSVAG